MTDLIKNRLNKNFKKQTHYLTLVFNDFFILALIFLFGALMFWYAQNIKKWPNNLWFYKPLLALIWTTTLGIGHFATLFNRADEHFLFNQDSEMKDYFKPLYLHNMILPVVLIILITGILLPFATMRAGFSIGGLIFIMIGLIASKNLQFKLIVRSFYFNKHDYYNTWLFLGINFIVLYLSFLGHYPNPLIYTTLAIAGGIGVDYLPRGKIFDWYKALDYEERRVDLLNNFYSMFTDVADKKVHISRRKYLDFLIKKDNQTPNTYIYQRVLLRDPEYSNLLIRMIIFASLLIACLQDARWAIASGALIIFLTLYQLIPLGTVYEHNMMYHVMPIPFKSRGQALRKVLQKGMLLEWGLVSLGLIIFSPQKLEAFEGVLLLLALTFLLLYFYLPSKIEQLFKKVRY
ncbi:ABC transporter permease [Lactobacillus taiwanensis]|uniref:ABC transporter permease n=1 Tax=Lactobacillus taiwanensis TaxID=508451 RepID=UPI00214C928E|nr:ABC transporter permease [Lactobacillus taiwanensis]MCR1917261.1 ABC transporter permease [Lactobacillus taiwanensis]